VALAGVIGVLLASGILYQWIATRRHRQRFAPPGEFVQVGLPRRSRLWPSAKAGHRLHVHCAGAGSPVVLLEAGIAASSLSWSLVQSEIAGFTRVCAYDRAGFAWSDAASCATTFEQIVSELTHVLAHVALDDQYVLVSHSVGGSTSTSPTTFSG
jgi:pimeloyl-ACP methyl ester carboxylesterase